MQRQRRGTRPVPPTVADPDPRPGRWVDDRSSVVAAGGAKASTFEPSDAASFDAMKIENMRLLSQAG